MPRPTLQLLSNEYGWSVFLTGQLVARLHHRRLVCKRDYLFYQVDGQWQRFIVELIDCTQLPAIRLIALIVEALISRGLYISDYRWYQDCKYVLDSHRINLVSKGRLIYASKKPLNEFCFVRMESGYPCSPRGTEALSVALRRDYREQLIMEGDVSQLHHGTRIDGPACSYQHHSLYIDSLLSANHPIIKLYDSTPQYSHLHGIIMGRFMHRPFAYAVVYRDCSERVLLHRIRKAIQDVFGLQFTKQHLVLQYVELRGEVTQPGALLLRSVSGRVVAACADGYYLNRRQIRDRLYLGGDYHGLHILQYPHLRKIIADHLATMVMDARHDAAELEDKCDDNIDEQTLAS